uniref:Protein kinase domain-containing protein n=1 Tax=Phytophthora ramorum TaxID=164328 RepID=H3GFI1_PHYRM
MERRRVRRAPLSLLLLAVLVHASLAENFADMSISARMAHLISAGIESPKLKLNTTLPVEVQYVLYEKALTWRDLGGTLQRLVLWDKGYVVTSSNTTRELRVRCGMNLDDVVVSRDEFQDLHDCPSTSCTDPVSSESVLHGTICADSQIKQMAKCAVLVSTNEERATSVDVETSLLWAEEGNNTDVPMPTVRRHSFESFAITLQTPTSGGDCPGQPALVIPCTVVDSSANSSEWCRPRKSGVVEGLLQDLVDIHQGHDASDTGTSGMLIAIWVVASALVLVLCVIGFMCFRRFFRRRSHQTPEMDLMEKATLEHCALTPEGIFFVDTSDSNGATGSMSSELSDLEAELEADVRRGYSSTSAPSEVDYSDALGASEVLLLFQNDPVVLALRVPIIDVNGDKMISHGRGKSPTEVLVGTLGSREVVLKRLRAPRRNDTCAVERLAREIRLAATLEHRNINLVAIWEYHRSRDLRRALRSGRKAQHWTWTQQKLQIAMALCGLGACAVRASSVMIEDKPSQTEENCIWSSPEVLSERKFSEKSDIYSFGVVLVALDTGKLLIDISRNHLLDLLTPVCPEFIHKIASDCLQDDPDARPTSRELLHRLETISG